MTAIVQVEGETYLHLSDGQFWVPARVSKQIADYIDKGSLFVFVCCFVFIMFLFVQGLLRLEISCS